MTLFMKRLGCVQRAFLEVGDVLRVLVVDGCAEKDDVANAMVHRLAL